MDPEKLKPLVAKLKVDREAAIIKNAEVKQKAKQTRAEEKRKVEIIEKTENTINNTIDNSLKKLNKSEEIELTPKRSRRLPTNSKQINAGETAMESKNKCKMHNAESMQRAKPKSKKVKKNCKKTSANRTRKYREMLSEEKKAEIQIALSKKEKRRIS